MMDVCSYIDFAKTFDKDSHQKLLLKLLKGGIHSGS